MGIQQLDNNNEYSKKEKEENQQASLNFFESKKLQRETSKLLQSLAQQIANDFGIDISEVKNLISSKTSGNLDNLKSTIGNNEQINLSDLRNAINSAKKQIEELAKSEIESLKNSLDDNNYSPDTHVYRASKKVIPENLLQKAYKPQNIWDQLVWATIGLIDSGEAIILYSYHLGKWILLSPYHFYLIITWKWKYSWFKNI